METLLSSGGLYPLDLASTTEKKGFHLSAEGKGGDLQQNAPAEKRRGAVVLHRRGKITTKMIKRRLMVSSPTTRKRRYRISNEGRRRALSAEGQASVATRRGKGTRTA